MTEAIAAQATAKDVSQTVLYEAPDVVTHTARRRARELPRFSEVLNEVPGRHRVAGLMQQMLQRQTVDRVAYNLLVPI